MEHAAVVARLMPRDRLFFFQHGDSRIGKAPADLVGRGQADDAAADDDDALSGHELVLKHETRKCQSPRNRSSRREEALTFSEESSGSPCVGCYGFLNSSVCADCVVPGQPVW